jgi:5'-nucleotidase
MSLRILLSNDDGVFAPGLLAICQALRAEGHAVTVCAPDRPRSASSHSITLHKPLRVAEVELADGFPAHAVSGTPSDCALIGLDEITKGEVDLVVSGINHGPNLGWDIIYSGTVAAAMEATILGFQAIAVSTASYDTHQRYDTAARFVAQKIVPKVEKHGIAPSTLLNVNVPNLDYDALKGVKLCQQGERRYKDRVMKREDPFGKPYYWVGGKPDLAAGKPGTDIEATEAGFVSVTPIDLDLTNLGLLKSMESWEL